MQIGGGRTLASLLEDAVDLRLLLHPEDEVVVEGADERDIRAEMTRQIRAAPRVQLLIGPEGGWTDDEVRACVEAGGRRWRIAESVLRIETAAVTAAVLLRYLAPPVSR